MVPLIESHLKSRFLGFLLARRVRKLIRIVPQEHLIGLDRIVLVDAISWRKGKEMGGIYRPKQDRELCSIELSIDSIHRGMPKVLHVVPFAASFVLASALYHEIGHHYQTRFTHGVGKQEREKFAERYSKDMMKRRFMWWLLFLSPLSSLIKRLRDKVTGKTH
jgi:hypothetical protein